MATAKLRSAALIAALSASVIGSPAPDTVAQRSFVPDGYDVPPYYPAPYGGWAGDWQESYRKARDFVASMTLAEKTNITAGSGIFMGKVFLRAL